nr:alpha/beta fold hydrolase [Halobacillus locisalis]
MSDKIIPGTGGWSFGLAGMVYEPFVLVLESMGYKRNKDLFINFYDWSDPIDHSAYHYLRRTIAYAKKTTGSEKVNLIAHSMGGLVSRAYVQSSDYVDDVDQMILLCTPNAGSAPNYSYWSGGELPVPSTSINFVHSYMKGYVDYLALRYPPSKILAIHQHFKGLENILPGCDYGNYVIMNHQGKSFVNYGDMQTQNHFLDRLNANKEVIQQRKVDVTVIAGTNEETIKYLEVVPSPLSNHWADGKVVGAAYTNEGDGDACLESVFSLDGDHYTVEGTHIEVLYKCEDLLRKKLKSSTG